MTIRTYQSDHNHFLRGFTMPVEVDCGGYTIFHVGDAAKADSEKVGVPAVVPFWGDRIV